MEGGGRVAASCFKKLYQAYKGKFALNFILPDLLRIDDVDKFVATTLWRLQQLCGFFVFTLLFFDNLINLFSFLNSNSIKSAPRRKTVRCFRFCSQALCTRIPIFLCPQTFCSGSKLYASILSAFVAFSTLHTYSKFNYFHFHHNYTPLLDL